MPQGDGGKIGIDLEVQLQKLQQDLNKAETKLKQSAKKMNESTKVNIGVADGLAKAFALMGGVEAGLKSITAVSSIFKGDMEAAQQAIETLPFGIGAAAAAARDLVDSFTGLGDELDEIEKLRKENAAEIRRRNAAVKKNKEEQNRAQAAADKTAETLHRQVALMNAQTDEQRQRIQLEQKLEQLRKQSAAARGLGQDTSNLDLGILRLRKSGEAKIAEQVEKKRADQAKKEADMQKAAANSLVALENRLLQQRLQNEGKTLRARIQGILLARNAEIKAAREAGDDRRANVLENLRDAERRAAVIAAQERGGAAAGDGGGLSTGSGGAFRAVEAGRFAFANAAVPGSKAPTKVRVEEVNPALNKAQLQELGLNVFFAIGGGG